MTTNYKEKKILEADFNFLEDLLHPLELRRDLLIEHLHIIQDYYGFLSEKNLTILSKLLKISKIEVYEVASFYAHFDIVKNDEIFPVFSNFLLFSLTSLLTSSPNSLQAQLR